MTGIKIESRGFPVLALSGSAGTRGERIGRALAGRIRDCLTVYRSLFLKVATLKDPAALDGLLRSRTERHAEAIQSGCPELAEEIEATARGAGLAAWEVYLLNSRTELFCELANHAKQGAAPNECTSAFFPQGAILGQTWDWHPALQGLAVILSIAQPDGAVLVTFTEPGIVGKIGLNSHGLGVSLNILDAPIQYGGIPIHVLLRTALERPSIKSAQTAISQLLSLNRAGVGTSSNILLAEANGAWVDLEVRGNSARSVDFSGAPVVHANHYLSEPLVETAENLNSRRRFAAATQRYRDLCNAGTAGMRTFLTDQSDPDFPICRGYGPSTYFTAGTVANLIIDLPQRAIEVWAPNPPGPSAFMESL